MCNLLLSKPSDLDLNHGFDIVTALPFESVNQDALVMLSLRTHKGNIPLNYASELGFEDIVLMILDLEKNFNEGLGVNS